jgi:hypothetical protein
MKDIINKINEGKYCPFFSEMQNEKSKNGEYHTYDYQDGVKKYKKGFFYLSEDEEYMGFHAFNNIKEYAEENGFNLKDYSPLESINIGESKTIGNLKYIRIW